MRALITIALFALSLSFVTPVTAQDSSAASSRKLVERSEPNYPALARHNGLSGTVKLRVTVGADGKARKVEVVGGNPVFVDSASDSVKRWKWASSDHDSTEVVEVKFGGSGNQGF